MTVVNSLVDAQFFKQVPRPSKWTTYFFEYGHVNNKT